MANVLITNDLQMDGVASCAYCDDAPHETRDVTVRCLAESDRSIICRLSQWLSADPRIHGQVVPVICLVIFIAIFGFLSFRFPVIRGDWFFFIAVPIVMLLTPLWRSLTTSWSRKSVSLPLCINHLRSIDKTLAERLKWPTWICLTAILIAAGVYFIGVAFGLVDALDGLPILGFTAMLFLPFWFVAAVWLTYRRTRYGIRRSENEIELWHCSDGFVGAIGHQRTMR